MNDYLQKMRHMYDSLKTYGKVALYSMSLIIACTNEKQASKLEQKITADSSSHKISIPSPGSTPPIILMYDSTNVGSDTTDNKQNLPHPGLPPPANLPPSGL